MKWIKVKDDLPDYRQKVLTYGKFNAKMQPDVSVNYRIESDRFTGASRKELDENHGFIGIQNVTHWMHLPEEPK